ncbi:hypothetical protein BDV12DRAFT_179659 [Aspergillus spectabilis]
MPSKKEKNLATKTDGSTMEEYPHGTERACPERFSDVIIDYLDRRFRVQRAIVCPQLQLIDKAVREGSEEAKETHIVLQQDSWAISCVLAWCFSIDYTLDDPCFPEVSAIPDSSSTGATSHPQDHLAVYKAADQFGVPKSSGVLLRT